MAKPVRGALHFPTASATLLEPYLPSAPPTSTTSHPRSKPFVTLTYATSLDASLSLSPGVQTALSGPLSKAMTHYTRSRHTAILVGVGTAVADNPSLNCRIEGAGGYGGQGLGLQPRPIVLDPMNRWAVGKESKVLQLAGEGRGLGPWVLVREDVRVEEEKQSGVNSVGGKYIHIGTESDGRMNWNDILSLLEREGIESVMVEGGGNVINDLLSSRYISLVDSVIVTIAPTWLGKGGVQVCPNERRDGVGKKVSVGRLKNVAWVPLGEDVVLCGRPVVD